MTRNVPHCMDGSGCTRERLVGSNYCAAHNGIARPFLEASAIVADRRVLRLTCPGEQWFATPSVPFAPHGLLIWGAPPGAYVKIEIYGTPVAGSVEGIPARLFDPTAAFERFAKLLDLPTVDTSCGVRVDLRTRDHKFIDGEAVEMCLWGLGVQR